MREEASWMQDKLKRGPISVDCCNRLMLSDYLSRRMCLLLEAGGKITDVIINNGICHGNPRAL